MPLQLAMVGCGGMGFRHTRGFIELASKFDTFRLAAEKHYSYLTPVPETN